METKFLEADVLQIVEESTKYQAVTVSVRTSEKKNIYCEYFSHYNDAVKQNPSFVCECPGLTPPAISQHT